MTRINCIPVTELHNRHLVAEYRELPRIFGLVRAADARGEEPDDRRNPNTYVLGTGHVRFFYRRLGYLADRYIQLCAEMKRRGFRVTYDEDPRVVHADIPAKWWGMWRPQLVALDINRGRIAARLKSMEATVA